MHPRWLAACVALAACSFDRPADVTFGEPAITILGGDHQTGVVAQPLALPFEVHVTDGDFRPIEDFTVEFAVREGDGTFSEASVRTDAQGNARTTYTAGTLAGEQLVDVGGNTFPDHAVFTVDALADVAAQLVAVEGNGAAATVATTLAPPLLARAEDRFGNAASMPLAVTFTPDVGSVSASPVDTDEEGGAATQFTLGQVAGAQTVTASAPGVTSALFTITGVADAPVIVERVTPTGLHAVTALVPSTPFVVIARDQYGNPAPGASIEFVRTQGDAVVNTPTTITGSDGTASTTITAQSFANVIHDIEARSTLDGAPIEFEARTGTFQAWTIDVPEATTSGIKALGVGDFNEDGKPDLIVGLASQLVVYFNTTNAGVATPSFVSGGTINAFGTIEDNSIVSIADTDGDGENDLLITSSAGTKIFRNQTTMGATSVAVLSPATLERVVAVADLDGDQRPDLITRAISSLAAYRSLAVGFEAGTPLGASSFDSACVHDLDGNGTLDVTAVDASDEMSTQTTVAWYINESSPGSLAFTSLSAPILRTPIRVACADLDGDDNIDWVLSDGSHRQILLGSASGAFSELDDEARVGDFYIMDVNGDGRPDLNTLDQGNLWVELGTGGGMFLPPTNPKTLSSPLSLQTADLNDTGIPELIYMEGTTSSAVHILGR